MRTFGIDPGLSGGLVLLSQKGKIKGKWVMPTSENTLDLSSLSQIFQEIKTSSAEFGGVFAYLELVHSMPKQGVASSFKFGRTFGVLEGMLTAFGIPFMLVTPQKWCKAMHEGVEKLEDPKKRSVIAAGRLFPNIDLRATERSRVPHSGMLDALLIAEWGRRQKYGEN